MNRISDMNRQLFVMLMPLVLVLGLACSGSSNGEPSLRSVGLDEDFDLEVDERLDLEDTE